MADVRLFDEHGNTKEVARIEPAGPSVIEPARPASESVSIQLFDQDGNLKDER